MIKSIHVAPPNSILLVTDYEFLGDMPEDPPIDSLVVASRSCIGIATVCSQDEDTEVVLTDEVSSAICTGLEIAFVGILSTPSSSIAVRTVLGDRLTDFSVSSKQVTLRIYSNDSKQPNKIVIIVSRA